MSDRSPGDVSVLLRSVRRGDPGAVDRLLPRVEAELRALAQERMRRLRRRTRGAEEASIDTAVLMDEAYLKLVGEQRDWQDRAHFLATAAARMRNICVDHARRILARKRGGSVEKLGLEDAVGLAGEQPIHPTEMIALDRALARLQALDPRQARFVELRFFAGLTDREIAEAEGVSESTVKREWKSARAWLYRDLRGEGAP